MAPIISPASLPHRRHPGRPALAGLAASLLLALAGPLAANSTTEGASGTFTILHTNDIHGRYMPFHVEPGNATAQTGDRARSYQEYARTGEVGGFAYLAGAIQHVRQARGAENVLLVDIGDTFADDLLANLTKGETIIRLMNSVGYQFMALGNHDFDYGLPQTRQLQRLADFPMRGANIIDEEIGQPVLGDPVKYFYVDGVKIAMLALGYHNTAMTGNKANFNGLKFVDGVETARRYVPQLRENADIVVLASHEGTRIDLDIAREVPGIDFIIGGHSHDGIAEPIRVGDTWVVQALSDGSALGNLQVTVEKGEITKVDYQLTTLWHGEVTPDPATAALVSQLRAPYESQLVDHVATVTEAIGRNYRSDSPFDVLTGEIMMAHTGADIAMLPGVGYGVTLYPGDMDREALYRLMPHPSKLATVDLSGAQVVELLEQSATNNRPADPKDIVGGLIQTAGISYVLDFDQPVGKRIREVKVAGKPIQADRRYKIATHNGMMGGLHKYHVLQQGQNIQATREGLTDLVETSLRERGDVVAPAAPSAILIDSARK